MQWVLDELAAEPTYVQRSMFGSQVALLRGKMVLGVIARKAPWNGLLICTSRDFHESLQKDFPGLAPHKILGKWLYIPQSHAHFEGLAQALSRAVLRGDPRIGIEPGTRKKRRK